MRTSNATKLMPRKQRDRIIATVLIALLGACGKTDRSQTTAERLGSVKELQETQADFYLPHKSVDYITDIKTLRENAAKAAEAAPPAKVAETKAAPTPVAPTPTPAPAPAPVVAPVVVAAAPAPQVIEPVREVVHTAPVRDATSCKLPDYPATSLRLEETGTVNLKILVDTNGNVVTSDVQSSSGHPRLDEAAVAAFSKCKFKPGTADGKVEQASASLKYTFRLN